MTAPKDKPSKPQAAKTPAKPRKAKPTAKTPQRAPQAAPAASLKQLKSALDELTRGIENATRAQVRLRAEIARLEKGSVH